MHVFSGKYDEVGSHFGYRTVGDKEAAELVLVMICKEKIKKKQ